jgi:hypothetical protein
VAATGKPESKREKWRLSILADGRVARPVLFPCPNVPLFKKGGLSVSLATFSPIAVFTKHSFFEQFYDHGYFQFSGGFISCFAVAEKP